MNMNGRQSVTWNILSMPAAAVYECERPLLADLKLNMRTAVYNGERPLATLKGHLKRVDGGLRT